MSTEIRVPTLGESVTEATIATWFKKPGDAVEVDEMLCELETDKVTVEVPSPVAGVLQEIVAQGRRYGGGERAVGECGGWSGRRRQACRNQPRRRMARQPPAAAASCAERRLLRPPRAATMWRMRHPPTRLMAEKGLSADQVDRHRPRRPHHEGRRARRAVERRRARRRDQTSPARPGQRKRTRCARNACA